MPTANADTSEAAIDAQVFWFRYRKEIAGFLMLVLLAIVGFAGWRFYRQHQDAVAAAAFAGAKTATDYQGVIDRYGDAPAAASAFLLLAEEQRKGGKLPESNATLQHFLDKFPRHELMNTARMSMAASLEAMGKLDEAAAAYQQIASVDPASYDAPLALLAQAQILQGKGRSDDARHIYETIMSQYQQSFAAMEAGQLLRTLKPAAVPVAGTNASPTAFPGLTPPSPAKP